jgi:formylglycine-generating enzyme required for sulfatase activity
MRSAVLSGAVLLGAAGCSHPLEAFVAARDAGAADTLASDTAVDTTPDGDTADGRASEASTLDASSDAVDATDAGPPTPEGACTLAAGPDIVCINGSDSIDLGARNAFVCPDAGCGSEAPVSVRLTQFFIDQREVSVGRFRAWWNLSPRPWPGGSTTYFRAGAKDLKWKGTWPSDAVEPAKGGDCSWLGAADASNDTLPLNCVDWFTALGFCLSEGKRLPTEAEWEWVASGNADRLFPWSPNGSEGGPLPAGEPTCAQARFGATCTPFTVGAPPTDWGRTRQGIYDMAGSLSEWVLDAFTPTYPFAAGTVDPFTDPVGVSPAPLRTARGGSYKSTAAAELRAAARPAAGVSATAQDLTIGFRCVKRP